MSEITWPYRLLAPGPVPVPAAVTRAMSGPLLHHRTPQFEKILIETWAGLKTVFGTQQPVMILTGSGSAAMEAAVVNILSPGDEALVVVSGKFGERWADMCERYGVTTHRLNVEWGQAVDLDIFSAHLKKLPRLKAVFTQACETSTASLHPVREMAKLVRSQSSALFAVDGITAVGCLELPLDEWDIDVLIGGSQKAFMIPPGLSFVALSERGWAAQKESRLPKFYLDLAAERKANQKNESHFTIPTPLVTGLHVVVQRLREVGKDHVMKRCQTLAAATRATGEAMGLSTFSKSPSPSVTALNVGKSASVRDWLERERHITVMGGQDQLKDKVLRIGHMGDVRDEDMVALFAALSDHLKIPFDKTNLLKALASVGPVFP